MPKQGVGTPMSSRSARGGDGSSIAPFTLDLPTIRARAREKMEQGAVTEAYRADRERVISVLNEALATEIVCALRYKNHYYMAKGIHSEPVAQEFLEHAQQEQEHADAIARRIVQLGGDPEFDPRVVVARSHTEYETADTLEAMIDENLVAERIAIDTYSEIIRWLGDDDPTTRRVMEQILEVEEEHADDLAQMRSELKQR